MAIERRHFIVDKLTAAGRSLVDSLLTDPTKTYQQIIISLKDRTGEKLNLSSLQRYHVHQLSLIRNDPDRIYNLVKETLGKINVAEEERVNVLRNQVSDQGGQSDLVH